jgi:outer membrane protein assembly factor BamD
MQRVYQMRGWCPFVRDILAVVTVAFLLTGCSMLDRFLHGEEEDLGPSELMADAMEKMESGNYVAATDAFQKMKDRYPYSKYALAAEMKIADMLFRREEYAQAYDAYDEFEKLHPKHKDIPYIIYQKGNCNFRQMKSMDREQTHTYKAKEEFERLVDRFPRDEYANRARKNLRECLIYLAAYELKVGHFYYKMGKYDAALLRYTYIIKNYPDMGQYNEALEYISRCKELIAEREAKAIKR